MKCARLSASVALPCGHSYISGPAGENGWGWRVRANVAPGMKCSRRADRTSIRHSDWSSPRLAHLSRPFYGWTSPKWRAGGNRCHRIYSAHLAPAGKSRSWRSTIECVVLQHTSRCPPAIISIFQWPAHPMGCGGISLVNYVLVVEDEWHLQNESSLLVLYAQNGPFCICAHAEAQ